MNLKSPHKDWKLDALAVPDARAVGRFELLTQLWLRVAHDNLPTKPRRETHTEVAKLAEKMAGEAPEFINFDVAVAEAWLRADLLSIFKRTPADFSVARPLHLAATKLRNTKQANDSGASGIVYSWLARRDPHLLAELRGWLEADEDDLQGELPSYALKLLAYREPDDVVVSNKPAQDSPPGICDRQGSVFVEDMRKLLAYRSHLPRSVVVEHLARLCMLHLGLYLLQTYRAVVDIARDGQPSCTGDCSGGDADSCGYRLQLMVDCGEDANSAVAELARGSWKQEEEVLGEYVRAHLKLKKLEQLAKDAANSTGRLPAPFRTLEELAAVPSKLSRSAFAGASSNLLQRLLESVDGEDRERLEQARDDYRAMGLDNFQAYLELIFAESERRWFNYLRYLLDSFFLKNESDGLLRQPLGGRKRVRRFVLSTGLLETLSLIALVTETSAGLETRAVRIDELVDRLADRYGLLVSRPASHLANDPGAVAAMVGNERLLKRRLRECGLFVDLSDAFLGQMLRPRVEVKA